MSSSPTPPCRITREQLENWLDSIGDYGCGTDEYWVPTKEAFEALCKLGISALSEKKVLVVDDGSIDPVALARMLADAPGEIVAIPSEIREPTDYEALRSLIQVRIDGMACRSDHDSQIACSELQDVLAAYDSMLFVPVDEYKDRHIADGQVGRVDLPLKDASPSSATNAPLPGGFEELFEKSLRDDKSHRRATPAENLRIMASRLDLVMSLAEKREIEEAAVLLEAKNPTGPKHYHTPPSTERGPDVAVWGPGKQHPGGQPYREGTSTGVTLPAQPSATDALTEVELTVLIDYHDNQDAAAEASGHDDAALYHALRSANFSAARDEIRKAQKVILDKMFGASADGKADG